MDVDHYISLQNLDPTQRQRQAKQGLRLAILLNQYLSQNRVSSPKHFKLLRYFSIVSLVAFVVATISLAFFYRQREIRHLVDFTEEKNVALAQVFANTLWPTYGPFLSSSQPLSNEELIADRQTQRLHDDILTQFNGLSVAKVKVFDLQGRTVFSTDSSQIGTDQSQSSGFLSAKSGQVVSQLDHQATFEALQQTLRDRHLLSSYLPIYGDDSDIVGVFELYTDVTPLLQRIQYTQRDILVGSLVLLTILYSCLFLFVRRAEKVLKKQYRQLQMSEGRYRQQASELEQALHDLRRTQAQMIQHEKMAGLGQMVAGIAHEINNPICFIYGNLIHAKTYCQDLLELFQLYQRTRNFNAAAIKSKEDEIDIDFLVEDFPKLLTSMELGTERIKQIVTSLRSFSRLGEACVKTVDIHEGIESTLVILQHRLKATPERPEITLIRNYDDQLPPVTCFPNQLNQVFMNLLNNAIDALDDHWQAHQEQLTIEPKTPDYSPTITIGTAATPDRVTITITDNGPGIPQTGITKIFEPFFTTKQSGKGTGLGLSISYQIIVDAHKGHLRCDSTPGKGTRFLIDIPIQDALKPAPPHTPQPTIHA